MRVVSQVTQVSQTFVSHDITDKFRAAASSKTIFSFLFQGFLYSACCTRWKYPVSDVVYILELKTGQLVKDEYFTLFDAVGALEVCSRCSPRYSQKTNKALANSIRGTRCIYRLWTRRWTVDSLPLGRTMRRPWKTITTWHET